MDHYIMNETAKTVTTPVMNNASDIDLEQLLRTYMPREKLRVVVHDQVSRVLMQHAGKASRAAARETHVMTMAADNIAGLHDCAAIALPPALCTLMVRLGFDKSLFTYGHAEGRPVGFAEGVWLLKFVGLADDAPAARPRMTSAA